MSTHPLYSRWRKMLSRCQDPKDKAYARYGGRGITVCDEWQTFKRYTQDVGLPPAPLMHLDRADNDKGYSKENCRWVTSTENNRNKSTNRHLVHNDELVTLAELSERTNVAADTLAYRLKVGRSVSEAVSAKTSGGREHFTKRDKFSSKYKGVRWNRAKQKWEARLTGHGGNDKFLGLFENEQKAAAACKRARANVDNLEPIRDRKIDEQTKRRVVSLWKAGKSYSQIQNNLDRKIGIGSISRLITIARLEGEGYEISDQNRI